MNQLVSAMKNLILQPPDLTRCSRFWFGLSFSPLQKKKITGRAARAGGSCHRILVFYRFCSARHGLIFSVAAGEVSASLVFRRGCDLPSTRSARDQITSSTESSLSIFSWREFFWARSLVADCSSFLILLQSTVGSWFFDFVLVWIVAG
jgi:hypothetical protein